MHMNYTFFKDSITGRKRGKDYLNKYLKFKEKFDISKDFIEYDENRRNAQSAA